MRAGTYLAGWAAIITVVAALGWGAWWWLPRALLPDWSGAPARLAEIMIAPAVPTGLARLLGSFGEFLRAPMFADDPAATEIARAGESVGYRIDGALHPTGCG